MLPDNIDLDLDGVLVAGRRLTDCGAELLGSRQTAGAGLEISGAQRPWGRDELGEAFGRRYEEAAAHTLDVWRITGERVMELGSQVKTAAGEIVETDRLTSEVIDSIL